VDKERVIELIKSDEPKDMHIHTAFSDGVLEPEDICKKWAEDGYKIIAITDHDGIGGSQIGVKIAPEYGLELIPGIEFDSMDALGKEIHILGYGIDFNNEVLQAALEQSSKWRDERNEEMLAVLREIGYDITDEEIYAVNQGRFVGKPTFARVLVKQGYAESVSEVFDVILKKDERLTSVMKRAMQSKEIIDIIHAAGGIAIMAHPMEQKRRSESQEEFRPRLVTILDKFVEYGVDGFECWHPSASEENSVFLQEYADAHGLLKTRGSDFHYVGIKRDYSRYM